HLRIVLEPVDNNFDVVLDATVELEVVGQADDLAIDASADEAALEHVLEEVLVFAFLAAHHRRQHKEARPLRQRHDASDDLLARLGRDRSATLRTVSLADARIEDAQIVVDLGNGADGRARVAACRLLLNADRWRQAGQVVHVRLLHLAHELPRIRRQRLDVASLSFGVERIKRQRRLARAADAGEDDQPVAGQFEVDVAKVVLAGATNDDVLAVIHNSVPVFLAFETSGELLVYTCLGKKPRGLKPPTAASRRTSARRGRPPLPLQCGRAYTTIREKGFVGDRSERIKYLSCKAFRDALHSFAPPTP